MTEYDISNGPLSTAVFLTVSDNGEKVWFTEYAANKIAYLDTTIPVPFEMQIGLNQNQNTDDNGSIYSLNNDSVIVPLVLKPSEEKILDVILKGKKFNSNNRSAGILINTNTSSPFDPSSSSLSFSEVELSVTGMTETGLVPGLTYLANPPAVGDPETIEYRGSLCIVMLIFSGFAALGVSILYRSLGQTRSESRLIIAPVLYAVIITLAFVLLPANPDEITISSQLLMNFRSVTTITMGIFWGVLVPC